MPIYKENIFCLGESKYTDTMMTITEWKLKLYKVITWWRHLFKMFWFFKFFLILSNKSLGASLISDLSLEFLWKVLNE